MKKKQLFLPCNFLNQQVKNNKTRRRILFLSGFSLNKHLRLFLRHVFQGFNQEIPELLNGADVYFFVRRVRVSDCRSK